MSVASVLSFFGSGTVPAYSASKGGLVQLTKSLAVAWAAGEVTNSYCSMHPASIDGVEQLIVSTAEGLAAFDPTSGKVLWQYDWPLVAQRVLSFYERTREVVGQTPARARRRLFRSRKSGVEGQGAVL